MILGIGTDLIHKEKIKNIYSRYEERFLKKILSTEEQETFYTLPEGKKINFLCSSFAAKEALVVFTISSKGIIASPPFFC